MRENDIMDDQMNLCKENALEEIDTFPFSVKKQLDDRIDKGVEIADEHKKDILFWSQKIRLLPREKADADVFLLRTKRYLDDALTPGE